MQVLRDYQVKAVDDILHKVNEGYRRILVVAPTGSGKTTLSSHIILKASEKKNRSMFIAHRKELIDQCSKRLDEHGVDHGIIKAGNKRYYPELLAQVASVMTLVRRTKNLPPCKIFFIDEAHRAMANSYLKVLEYYPDALVIGLTATPFRLDGKGLGHIFDTIVSCSSTAELTEKGYLVPARYFSTPLTPKVSDFHIKMGEYDTKEQEEAFSKADIIGDIYRNWKKRGEGRKTVCFAVNRIHAHNLMETFKAEGVKAAYIDGEMKESEREDILFDYEFGDTDIIFNVGILTEGWDAPITSCIILARGTNSLALYLQMAGRALRLHPASGKVDCIILDHGSNVMNHGFVTDERIYDLSGLSNKNKSESIAKIKNCPECFAIFSGTRCPNCGYIQVQTQNRDITAVDADLVEIDPKKVLNDQKRYLHEMLRQQVHYKWKDNFAAVRFKDTYGVWPGKQVGVKPMWQYDHVAGKSKITGWDYSKAFKEAGIAVQKKVGSGSVKSSLERIRQASRV